MLDKFRVNYSDYMVGSLCFLYDHPSLCRHIHAPLFLLPTCFNECFDVEIPLSVILVVLKVTGVAIYTRRKDIEIDGFVVSSRQYTGAVSQLTMHSDL